MWGGLQLLGKTSQWRSTSWKTGGNLYSYKETCYILSYDSSVMIWLENCYVRREKLTSHSARVFSVFFPQLNQFHCPGSCFLIVCVIHYMSVSACSTRHTISLSFGSITGCFSAGSDVLHFENFVISQCYMVYRMIFCWDDKNSHQAKGRVGLLSFRMSLSHSWINGCIFPDKKSCLKACCCL